MKKVFFIAACGLILATMLSCNDDTDFHSTSIYYPYAGRAMVYADQPMDSIAFSCTESWVVSSSMPWCTVSTNIAKVDNPYKNIIIEASGFIYFEPNLTGEWRSSVITIHAEEYSAQVAYYQAPNLHLIRPGRDFDENGFPTQLNALTDSASWTTDSVTFETFGAWTLASQKGLLTPAKESGPSGVHTVSFSFSKNGSTSERVDTLLLTSCGVTDKIPVKQLPVNK